MKILLVDDSKSARYALRLQLQRHGAEVDTAESAEAAFTKLKGALPDAILMDHMMPGLNGFEALEVLREDPRTSAIPVIMCTSHEEPEFVAQAKKKGVFDILPKSAAPELLPDMMEKLQGSLGIVATPPAKAAPAPLPSAEASMSEDTVRTLVDARLDARIASLMPKLGDELRRDLSSEILGEAQRIVDERFAADQAAKRNAAPQPTMADLQAISTRLATETVPDLIKRSLQAERTQIMASVEKQVRESQSKAAGQQQDSEELAANAVAIASRESQETVQAALATSQEAIQQIELSLRKAKTTIYVLVSLAALLGIGAAGAVYYLLSAAA